MSNARQVIPVTYRRLFPNSQYMTVFARGAEDPAAEAGLLVILEYGAVLVDKDGIMHSAWPQFGAAGVAKSAYWSEIMDLNDSKHGPVLVEHVQSFLASLGE